MDKPALKNKGLFSLMRDFFDFEADFWYIEAEHERKALMSEENENQWDLSVEPGSVGDQSAFRDPLEIIEEPDPTPGNPFRKRYRTVARRIISNINGLRFILAGQLVRTKKKQQEAGEYLLALRAFFQDGFASLNERWDNHPHFTQGTAMGHKLNHSLATTHNLVDIKSILGLEHLTLVHEHS